jgi:hypothetical protein
MEDPTMSNGLIFYTDGQKVFDKFNNPIDPTKVLNGDPSNSQGVTIIPKTSCKGCQAEYYVFTLSKNAKGENLIFYSIVDMKMNKGKGGISVLNDTLSPVPTTSRILATEGGEGFYWLVTQDADPLATSTTTRIFKVSASNTITALSAFAGISAVNTMDRFKNDTIIGLFSGAQGAWYDPSDLTTLFQDSAGTNALMLPALKGHADVATFLVTEWETLIWAENNEWAQKLLHNNISV